MDYQPLSEEQYQKEKAAQGTWPKGVYEFEIQPSAQLGQNNTMFYTMEKTSKKGNDMIETVVCVYHPTGAKRIIIDYLVPSMETKFYSVFAATGLLDKYRNKTVTANDLHGKRGKLNLGIETNDRGNEVNKIYDYVPLEENSTQQAVYDAYAPSNSENPAPSGFQEDDIPL